MKHTQQRQPSQPAPAQEGGSWQFVAILIVIVVGVLGLVLKTFGIF